MKKITLMLFAFFALAINVMAQESAEIFIINESKPFLVVSSI